LLPEGFVITLIYIKSNWQEYAAAVTAATAKEILLIVRERDIVMMSRFLAIAFKIVSFLSYFQVATVNGESFHISPPRFYKLDQKSMTMIHRGELGSNHCSATVPILEFRENSMSTACTRPAALEM
jgi:hypothetical protein